MIPRQYAQHQHPFPFSIGYLFFWGKAVKYSTSGAADHSDAAYGVKHTAIL